MTLSDRPLVPLEGEWHFFGLKNEDPKVPVFSASIVA